MLAADTVVHMGADIFGKPTSALNAMEVLAALSGKWHKVTTAWCLWDGISNQPTHHEHTTTRVCFRTLDAATIAVYVSTGEGLDKAGGYGIQGIGSALIEEVQGSYSNVVGLPLRPVLSALNDVGVLPEIGTGV